MNKIFDEKGKKLTTAKELEDAYYANQPDALKRYSYDLERVTGSICNCYGNGIFDLLPLDNEAVVEGDKRYMKCRICGDYSHL